MVSVEDLLKLIHDDALDEENIIRFLEYVNVSKDVNNGYFTPLMNAIHYKRTKAIKILIGAGANPNIKIKVSYHSSNHLQKKIPTQNSFFHTPCVYVNMLCLF